MTYVEIVEPPGRLLVTVIEAAAVLAVGRTTVYELIGTGELRVVHIGRSVRIAVVELQRYVELKSDTRHGQVAAHDPVGDGHGTRNGPA